MHTCDNPGCVNPEHLVLGSQADNIKDMDTKSRRGSRNVRRERNPNSKLTEQDVETIRKRYKRYSRTDGTYQLAREFGVSSTQINLIIKGKYWK